MVFMNSSQGGAGKAMSFRQEPRQNVQERRKKVTFSDVAGLKKKKRGTAGNRGFSASSQKIYGSGRENTKGVLLVGPSGNR